MWPLALPEPSNADDESAEEQEVQLPPEVQAWEELPAAEKLIRLLSHLRKQHHHCLFCGAQVRIRLLDRQIIKACSEVASCSAAMAMGTRLGHSGGAFGMFSWRPGDSSASASVNILIYQLPGT